MANVKKLELQFDGLATGFVGSTKSGFGENVPASTISITGGGQIQTITQWNCEGYQVPVYAYVAAGIPTATLTAERGLSTLDYEPAACSATFVNVGGGCTTIEIPVSMPEPSTARSAGANGATFTWIADVDPSDPYANL